MITVSREDLLRQYKYRGKPVPDMVAESEPDTLFCYGFSLFGNLPLHKFGSLVVTEPKFRGYPQQCRRRQRLEPTKDD